MVPTDRDAQRTTARDMSPELAGFLAGQVGRGVPGIAVALVHGGDIRWARGFGRADLATARPADARTAFLWFSMTKLVTATAAMQLVDRQLLDLDAPITDVLPAYAALLAPRQGRAITARHLLSHSAGLPNPIPLAWVHPAGVPAPDPDAFLRPLLVRYRDRISAPGREARYSNLGYLILGAVIAAVSGQPYEGYVRAHILRPLGMLRTDFHYTAEMLPNVATGYQRRWSPMTPLLRRLVPAGIVGDPVGRYVAFRRFEVSGAPYGGLIGPVADAAHFLAAHANGGTFAGVRLLSPAAVTAMQALATRGPKLDVGFGWFRSRRDSRRGRAFVEHTGGGGGFYNLLRLYPERSLGIAIMGNATSYRLARIAAAIARSS